VHKRYTCAAGAGSTETRPKHAFTALQLVLEEFELWRPDLRVAQPMLWHCVHRSWVQDLIAVQSWCYTQQLERHMLLLHSSMITS
jgi:hypothetical protein